MGEGCRSIANENILQTRLSITKDRMSAWKRGGMLTDTLFKYPITRLKLIYGET